MKKHFQYLVCLIIFSAFGFSTALADDDPITSRVGVYENAPKIYTAEDGTVSGFWPDLIRHIAAEEGWEIEWVPGTWTQGLKQLENNQIETIPDWIKSALMFGGGTIVFLLTVVTVSRIQVRRKTSALRESEKKYRSLIEQSNDAIYLLYDNKFELCNPKFEQLFGITSEEVSSPDFDYRKLVAPKSHPIVDERLRKIADGERLSPRYTFTALNKDGNEIEVQVSASYISYRGGTATQGILRDVTEQVQTKKELERLLNRQTATTQLALALGKSRDLDNIYLTIYEHVRTIMDADAFVISYYDKETQLIRAGCVMYAGDALDALTFPPIPLEAEGHGTQSRVIHSGEPFYNRDYRQTESTTKTKYTVDANGTITAGSPPTGEAEDEINSAIFVPMKIEGETIGVMQVQSYRFDAYTQENIDTLSALANVIALAIQNARLFAETQRFLKQQAALLDLSTSLAVSIKEDILLETAVKGLQTNLSYDHLGIFLVDERTGDRVLRASEGWEDIPDDWRIPPNQGLSERPLLDGRLHYTPDVKKEPRHVKGRTLGSEVDLPIRVSDDVIGVMIVENKETNAFNQDDLSVLTTASNQISVALERARLFDDESRRRQEAEMLRTSAHAVSASLELDQILNEILVQLKQTLTYSAASVLILRGGNKPELVAGSGYADVEMTTSEAKGLLENSPILSQMRQDHQPVFCPDVRELEGWIWVPGAEHVRSWMGIPLVTRGRMLGALMIDSAKPDFFDEQDLHIAQILAQHVAQAIDNALLFEQVSASRQRLNSLSRQLVQVQENERRSLARELHDQIGQSLTAVKLNLQTLQHLAGHNQLAHDLQESVSIADRALMRVRDLSLNLRPSVLDDFGLDAALRWYIKHQSQWADFTITLNCDLPAERLPPEIETTSYRIIQTALTNVARHTEAKHVGVNVSIESDQTLRLIIEDDGKGFDVEAALQRAVEGKSLGLLSMQDRAKQV
ncbi:MAG: GAF domain-containing protein, partial [Chloroflexota bacterium]|nr:GAF domain-containing protein [Chloroflexota bacterium]